LYISQAYSTSESAIDRTSDFSPPYSLLFNAVQHNYAIIEKNGFNPIPFKVKLNEKINIAGILLNNT
jgi:hypothetical protein